MGGEAGAPSISPVEKKVIDDEVRFRCGRSLGLL